MSQVITQQIASEISASTQQVDAAVKLLDDGATVPFIARYRKEVTGGLDDGQLRELEQRLGYLRELEKRRETILSSVEQQGKLSDSLRSSIEAAATKTELEDLYLPYKPKRRTKGQIAIEAGIEPLADALFENPQLNPEQAAQSYLNAEAGFADNKAVLDGAKFILMERFAVDANLLGSLRQLMQGSALMESKLVPGQEQAAQKFRDYFDYQEALNKVPSHRALALLRGRNEGFLQLSLSLGEEPSTNPAEAVIAQHFGIAQQGRPADSWLASVVQWTWRVKLKLQFETELLNQLREMAENEAISVFSKNLKDLLMAAPAGAKATMGLDPGLRTGVKVAVVSNTGKLLDTATIYPHPPQKQWRQSLAVLAELINKHAVELVSIGNGTASRETDKLAGELLKALAKPQIQKVVVSEAGASVYSASELAAKEFPDLDVSLRGAVSIARRVQDPLAELVKIDPKSIGVGQYQHDVNQQQLSQQLDRVVEDCVNAVGVDLNMASAPLLSYVAGLNSTIAQNIVDYRDQTGAFTDRKQLKKVARLGPKAFEQAAGFLRIREGNNALDASAVHPEAYQVAQAIAVDCGVALSELLGNSGLLKRVKPQQFTSEQFGLPTVNDIISELQKPGRDPRPAFVTANFKEGVEKVSDLEPGMRLEGVVTNVTNFGAFVDIGVHQDGLVHISCLANHFVKDPHQVVKAGDVVTVLVTEVDQARKRIALSMRLDDKFGEQAESAKPARSAGNSASQHPRSAPRSKAKPAAPAANSAFADAFAKAKRGR